MKALRTHLKDSSHVSPYMIMFRFSFGPLLCETLYEMFEDDFQLMSGVLDLYKADVAPDVTGSP